MDYVERVSENMQLFAPEDVLNGRDFLYEYDPEVCINKYRAKIYTVNLIRINESFDNAPIMILTFSMKTFTVLMFSVTNRKLYMYQQGLIEEKCRKTKQTCLQCILYMNQSL